MSTMHVYAPPVRCDFMAAQSFALPTTPGSACGAGTRRRDHPLSERDEAVSCVLIRQRRFSIEEGRQPDESRRCDEYRRRLRRRFPQRWTFGFGAFPVHPEIGPSWKVRAAIVILLPRAARP